ncbi:MAG: hypothetical protein IKY94_16215 [Lachnospiraceae bacterium]|nr:hypothetical protein [Lachnospiraceae bacterium]
MLQQVETMFEDMAPMLKGLKKKNYETNMKAFREKNNEFFFQMMDQLKTEKKEVVAKHISNSFVAAVKQIFEKRGKIKGKVQMDLNFFMIYYVFPAILMTQSDDAKLMADTLCETWGNSFKDAKIGYTDYDTLYESFKEKIFGIF